jgi:two-component system nitrate/nitrite response regulator NarL
MKTNPTHIFIADDHHLFAEGLIALLKQYNDNFIFTHIHRGDILIKSIKKHNPQLILLDIKMLGLEGIKSLEIIKKENSSIKIIVISTFSDVETIINCLVKGADAFTLKTTNIKALKKTIEKVLHPKFVNNYKITFDKDNLFEMISFQFKITKREWEIIQFIKIGETNKQISSRLFLSIFTIETHRKNIMQKLNLKTPAELIRFIIEYKI